MEEGDSSLIMGHDHHPLGPAQMGLELGEEAQRRHHGERH